MIYYLLTRKNLAEYKGEIRSQRTFKIIIGPVRGGMSQATPIFIPAENQQQAATRAKRMHPGSVIYSIDG